MSLATVKVSPIDPDLLLLAGRDGAVLTSLEPVLAPRTLAREPVYRDAAHFSPDGSRLITGTQSGRVEVWDAASGTGLGLLTGHGTLVYSASFHPAGRWGITSSRDGTVRLWDTAAAQPLISAGVHAEVVWAASFAPDGSRYLAASQDGAIRLFPFAAETAAITDLEDAALVLSGVRRDLSGSAAPATAEELEQAFERLHRSPLLRPLAAGATAAAWHREEARTAARERRWDAAERHLGEVIRVDESRWMDHAARGRALAELGRYEAGAAELELAARTHREADLLADLARLRLARGDVEGYRRLRSELLERFGATRNPDRAARVTRAALLVEPAGGLEAQRLVELARLRLETEGAHAEALETLAAALLRAEESQAALRAFDEAAVARQGGESSWSAAFRSLAHRQRGNGRGAEEWRRRAAVLGGETWQERLEGELLGRTLGDR